MIRSTILLGMSLVFLFCSGFMCNAKRPDSVSEASKLRKKAYLAANESKNDIIKTVVEVYREAEYKRIDLEINAALEEDFAKVKANAAATGGAINADVAIAGTKRLIDFRDKERNAARKSVDDKLKQIDDIIARADTNILIANKLNDAVEEYESAGVDVTAAGKAIEEILSLVEKQNKPKSKAPVLE